MRRIFTCLLLLTLGFAGADDKILSGPQVGERLTSFKVRVVSDDPQDQDFDFILSANGRPTLLIFMHNISRPAASLARALSTYAHERAKDGLKAYVVWLA